MDLKTFLEDYVKDVPDSKIVGHILKTEKHYHAFIETEYGLIATFGETLEELMDNVKDAKALLQQDDKIEFKVKMRIFEFDK